MFDAINRVFVRAMLATKREDGQTFVEYALIGVLIAAGAVVALTLVGTNLGTELKKISDALLK